MAGLASPATGLYARSRARRLVRSLGMGRRRCVAVVLGSRPGSDRCLLPPPKSWPAQLGEGRRAMAQSPDRAWRSAVDPPWPRFVALGRVAIPQTVMVGITLGSAYPVSSGTPDLS